MFPAASFAKSIDTSDSDDNNNNNDFDDNATVSKYEI